MDGGTYVDRSDHTGTALTRLGMGRVAVMVGKGCVQLGCVCKSTLYEIDKSMK